MSYREKDNIIVIHCNMNNNNNNSLYRLRCIALKLSIGVSDHSKIVLFYKCYDDIKFFTSSVPQLKILIIFIDNRLEIIKRNL